MGTYPFSNIKEDPIDSVLFLTGALNASIAELFSFPRSSIPWGSFRTSGRARSLIKNINMRVEDVVHAHSTVWMGIPAATKVQVHGINVTSRVPESSIGVAESGTKFCIFASSFIAVKKVLDADERAAHDINGEVAKNRG